MRSAVEVGTPGPIFPELLSKLKLTMSASRPAIPRTRSAPPPIMIGGRGSRAGTPENPWTDTWSPSTSIGSPEKCALITSTYSSRREIRVPARSMVRPMASYSPPSQPAPRPSSRRPSERRSIVAASLARITAGR